MPASNGFRINNNMAKISNTPSSILTPLSLDTAREMKSVVNGDNIFSYPSFGEIQVSQNKERVRDDG
jgi:hypothetical protein